MLPGGDGGQTAGGRPWLKRRVARHGRMDGARGRPHARSGGGAGDAASAPRSGARSRGCGRRRGRGSGACSSMGRVQRGPDHALPRRGAFHRVPADRGAGGAAGAVRGIGLEAARGERGGAASRRHSDRTAEPQNGVSGGAMADAAGRQRRSPSGGRGGTDPAEAQLIKELREEVGITAELPWVGAPICMVEHPGSHVLDIGSGSGADGGSGGARLARASRRWRYD